MADGDFGYDAIEDLVQTRTRGHAMSVTRTASSPERHAAGATTQSQPPSGHFLRKQFSHGILHGVASVPEAIPFAAASKRTTPVAGTAYGALFLRKRRADTAKSKPTAGERWDKTSSARKQPKPKKRPARLQLHSKTMPVATVGNKKSARGASDALEDEQQRTLDRLAALDVGPDPFPKNTEFTTVLWSEACRPFLLKHLESEFSTDNLRFVVACEQLQKEGDAAEKGYLLDCIFAEYIALACPCPMNISTNCRTLAIQAYQNREESIDAAHAALEAACTEIVKLMGRDSFNRFKSSVLWRAMNQHSRAYHVAKKRKDALQTEARSSLYKRSTRMGWLYQKLARSSFNFSEPTKTWLVRNCVLSDLTVRRDQVPVRCSDWWKDKMERTAMHDRKAAHRRLRPIRPPESITVPPPPPPPPPDEEEDEEGHGGDKAWESDDEVEETGPVVFTEDAGDDGDAATADGNNETDDEDDPVVDDSPKPPDSRITWSDCLTQHHRKVADYTRATAPELALLCDTIEQVEQWRTKFFKEMSCPVSKPALTRLLSPRSKGRFDMKVLRGQKIVFKYIEPLFDQWGLGFQDTAHALVELQSIQARLGLAVTGPEGTRLRGSSSAPRPRSSTSAPGNTSRGGSGPATPRARQSPIMSSEATTRLDTISWEAPIDGPQQTLRPGATADTLAAPVADSSKSHCELDLQTLAALKDEGPVEHMFAPVIDTLSHILQRGVWEGFEASAEYKSIREKREEDFRLAYEHWQAESAIRKAEAARLKEEREAAATAKAQKAEALRLERIEAEAKEAARKRLRAIELEAQRKRDVMTALKKEANREAALKKARDASEAAEDMEGFAEATEAPAIFNSQRTGQLWIPPYGAWGQSYRTNSSSPPEGWVAPEYRSLVVQIHQCKRSGPVLFDSVYCTLSIDSHTRKAKPGVAHGCDTTTSWCWSETDRLELPLSSTSQYVTCRVYRTSDDLFLGYCQIPVQKVLQQWEELAKGSPKAADTRKVQTAGPKHNLPWTTFDLFHSEFRPNPTEKNTSRPPVVQGQDHAYLLISLKLHAFIYPSKQVAQDNHEHVLHTPKAPPGPPEITYQDASFIKDGYSLDLVYFVHEGSSLSQRIALFGKPLASCLEDLQTLFELRHPNAYKVYSLCTERESSFPASAFRGNVACLPIADKQPCTLDLLLPFCEDARAWLQAHPQNVIALSCGNGRTRGRAAMLLACLLVYMDEASTSAAVKMLKKVRVKGTAAAVYMPSQIRYVNYFNSCCHMWRRGHRVPRQTTLFVEAVTLTSHSGSNLEVMICIDQTDAAPKEFGRGSLVDGTSRTKLTWDLSSKAVALSNDVRFKFFLKEKFGNQFMFQFWFNTRLQPLTKQADGGLHVKFKRVQLDRLSKAAGQLLGKDFSVSVHVTDTLVSSRVKEHELDCALFPCKNMALKLAASGVSRNGSNRSSPRSKQSVPPPPGAPTGDSPEPPPPPEELPDAGPSLQRLSSTVPPPPSFRRTSSAVPPPPPPQFEPLAI